MMTTVGRLCDQSAVRRLQMDDVTFTYIVDGAMAMAPEQFLQSVPSGYGLKGVGSWAWSR
jgi:hypothetical protein